MIRIEEVLFMVGLISLFLQWRWNVISTYKSITIPVGADIRTITISPGINYFKVVGVQEFGTVQPPEYTEGGRPKNTTIDLNEICIEFHPEHGTCVIDVRDE